MASPTPRAHRPTALFYSHHATPAHRYVARPPHHATACITERHFSGASRAAFVKPRRADGRTRAPRRCARDSSGGTRGRCRSATQGVRLRTRGLIVRHVAPDDNHRPRRHRHEGRPRPHARQPSGHAPRAEAHPKTRASPRPRKGPPRRASSPPRRASSPPRRATSPARKCNFSLTPCFGRPTLAVLLGTAFHFRRACCTLGPTSSI